MPRLILLLALLVLAAVVRFSFIGAESLFFDEAWHMELSTGRGSLHLRLPVDVLIADVPNTLDLRDAPPWYAIWNNMDWVIHPPLYHLLLRPWREIVGESGIVARSFSVVWSLLAIVLLFDVARRLHGVGPALWACALMSVSATQIAIAQEARGYALLLALGLGMLWFLVRIRQSGVTMARLIGLGLCAAAMLLTHYFAAGAIAGMGLYALLRLRGKMRVATSGAIAAGLLLFIVTWGSTLWRQLSYVEESADIFLKEPREGHLVRTAMRLMALPARLVYLPHDDTPAWASLGLPVLLLAAVALWRDPSRDAARSSQRDALLMWALWLIGGIGSIALLDLARSTHHLEFVRYTAITSPAICAIISGCAWRYRSWLRHAPAAAACLLGLLTISRGYERGNLDLRPAAHYLAANAQPGQMLIIASPNPQGRDGQTLLLGMALYAEIFPRDTVIVTRPMHPSLLAELSPREALLLSPLRDLPADAIVPGSITIDRQQFEAADCFRIRLP